MNLLEGKAKHIEDKISEYLDSNNKRMNLLRDQVFGLINLFNEHLR